jgi:hypothetical protein
MVTEGTVSRHRAQRLPSAGDVRHDFRASPQDSQSGGRSGGILSQHAPQTALRVGCSRAAWQAAQTGESTTLMNASEAAFVHVDTLGITP